MRANCCINLHFPQQRPSFLCHVQGMSTWRNLRSVVILGCAYRSWSQCESTHLDSSSDYDCCQDSSSGNVVVEFQLLLLRPLMLTYVRSPRAVPNPTVSYLKYFTIQNATAFQTEPKASVHIHARVPLLVSARSHVSQQRGAAQRAQCEARCSQITGLWEQAGPVSPDQTLFASVPLPRSQRAGTPSNPPQFRSSHLFVKYLIS